MPDDPMNEEELGEYVAARFRQLIRLGVRDGGAAMHAKVEQLPEDEVRLLLTTALGFEIARARGIAAATTN
jgi:hypothetical protein